ncbi:MAG: hypothetical protein MUO26_01315 [Methanotrichaceae archaeon]|nr:hypothetical protein [Methanotrichaceae archaeon]
MKLLLTILMAILMAYQAAATVENPGMTSGTPVMTSGAPVTGAIWPPSVPSLPKSLPCPINQGFLAVSVDLTGPKSEEDKGYTVQGRPLDFVVTVDNRGPADVETELCVLPEGCAPQWFSWTTKTLSIPAGASRSEGLQVTPDINSVAGEYKFEVEASAKCSKPGKANGCFRVQNYDYVSETYVSGTGQFQMSKDVSSMNSGIKSDKDLNFVGSVDSLIKNEYLVEQAKGRTPNFQEQDAVDNYNSLGWGTLQGSEVFKSSKVFGGVGARVNENYNLAQMEYQNQNFNLHQTGSLKKMAEFKTADNFTGYLALEAKQSIPGQRSQKEKEVYMGSFEIARRFVFRDNPTNSQPCSDGSCAKPSSGMPCFGGSCLTSPPYYNPPCFGGQCTGNPPFSPPCSTGSCAEFVQNLNNFVKSA